MCYIWLIWLYWSVLSECVLKVHQVRAPKIKKHVTEMRGAIKCSQVGVFNLKMWSCNRLFQGDLFFCCLCFFCSGGGAGRRRRSGEELGAQYGGRYSWASGRDSGGRGGGGSDWPFGAFLELAWLIMADIHLPPKNKYGMRSTIILCWLTYNKEIYICRISHTPTEKEGIYWFVWYLPFNEECITIT